MILINLLPHRERRRLARKRGFFLGLLGSAVAGVGMVVFGLSFFTQLTNLQESRNEYLRAEIKKLEGQIKDIATLRSEIEALKARQKAIEDLQTDRNVPVHLLNELVKHVPDGLYLRSMVQVGGGVVLNGYAQSNERVSELLRNTSQNGVWVERPELIEIKSASGGPSTRDSSRVYEFSIRLRVKRPESPGAGVKSSGTKAS